VQRRYIEAIVARAGVDLTPVAAWLLMRIETDSDINVDELARKYHIRRETLDGAVAQLQGRGLVDETSLTEAGCAVLEKMVNARRERLAELRYEWPIERREDMATLLDGLAHELIPEARSPHTDISR
jgi:DNA-binding MarR family transcriptional regulator